MIVRESKDTFTLIAQHDHATLSGEMFMMLKRDFVSAEHYESLSFAIFQHDRAWQVPDSAPIWDDLRQKPFDFNTYPEELKVSFYKNGIDQVDRVNSYSALLCSKHYSSFYQHSTDEIGRSFYEREIQRQKHLMGKLKVHKDFLDYQLRILKFCDDLSLYVCMNKVGASKVEEIDLFKKGFDNSELFNDRNDTKIVASYVDRKTISFNVSPFSKRFDVKVPVKVVRKERIAETGLLQAYKEEKFSHMLVQIGL
ncbi:hypothetical protein Pedsa_0151 [Pseudopedobacter saltans DSM 12145]|uniref:DUF3891 domain-containing protein n=1 Tax=Pseudopedobacter saltans (strain ATCC 51119 / DSM 12145 / JCM 21818 / CCUG 39354 / LMG 10337 / NBRC 100064 / NCIMB 13643) TaxID=762903 RepID=F0SDL0_PSESL|nr:DUF3891 family protein [Pseudopedobacter saltans]ADY50737.1 hypothetical protein Pedsa_0151 [Pseudopedobacter saltans DSM 12145]